MRQEEPTRCLPVPKAWCSGTEGRDGDGGCCRSGCRCQELDPKERRRQEPKKIEVGT